MAETAIWARSIDLNDQRHVGHFLKEQDLECDETADARVLLLLLNTSSDLEEN